MTLIEQIRDLSLATLSPGVGAMNEDTRLQDAKTEYLRRAAPIVKLLGDIEQFRRWSIEVDKEGNYTAMQCAFPPELQRIYDFAMETLKEMRVVYAPLVANAVANQEAPNVWQCGPVIHITQGEPT